MRTLRVAACAVWLHAGGGGRRERRGGGGNARSSRGIRRAGEVRGCGWGADLHGVFRARRAAGRGPRRSGRLARLLPAVPAAARPAQPPRVHRRARLGQVGEARGRLEVHGRDHGRGRGGGQEGPGPRQDQPAGALLRRRARPGVRLQVPGEPVAPGAVQHVPQHEGDERGLPADEGEDAPGAARRGSTGWRRRACTVTARTTRRTATRTTT